jgi:hypothetical protein
MNLRSLELKSVSKTFYSHWISPAFARTNRFLQVLMLSLLRAQSLKSWAIKRKEAPHEAPAGSWRGKKNFNRSITNRSIRSPAESSKNLCLLKMMLSLPKMFTLQKSRTRWGPVKASNSKIKATLTSYCWNLSNQNE